MDIQKNAEALASAEHLFRPGVAAWPVIELQEDRNSSEEVRS
ncbi:hypothetical protein [Stigmatella hybrida]|nr:hypothetical protein [Stigmatella hybrida]